MTDSIEKNRDSGKRSGRVQDSRDVSEDGPILIAPSTTVARSSPGDLNMETERPAAESDSTPVLTHSSSEGGPEGGPGTAGYVLMGVVVFFLPSVALSLFFLRWFRRRTEAQRQARGSDGHLYDSPTRRKHQVVSDRSVLLDSPNRKRNCLGGGMSFFSPLKSLYERVQTLRSEKTKKGLAAVDAPQDPPNTPAETTPETVISPSPDASPDGMIIELPVLTSDGSGTSNFHGAADESHQHSATTVPMKVSVVPTDGKLGRVGMPVGPPIAPSGLAGGRNTPSNHSQISDITGSLFGLSRPPSRNEVACVNSPRALGATVCGGVGANAAVESVAQTGKKGVVEASTSGTDLEAGIGVVTEIEGSATDETGLDGAGFTTDEDYVSGGDDADGSPEPGALVSRATTPGSLQRAAADIAVTRPADASAYVRSVFDYMVCTSTPLDTIPEEVDNPKQQGHPNETRTIAGAPNCSPRTPMWGVAPSATVDSDDPRVVARDSQREVSESMPQTESAARSGTPFSQQHFESFELVLEPASLSPATPKNLSFDFAEAAGEAGHQRPFSPPLAASSSRTGIFSASTRHRGGGRPGVSFDASTMGESAGPSSSTGTKLRQSFALAAKWKSAFAPVGRWRGSFRSAASSASVMEAQEPPRDGIQRSESAPPDHAATLSKDADVVGQGKDKYITVVRSQGSGAPANENDTVKKLKNENGNPNTTSVLNARYEFRNASSILPSSGTESDEDGTKKRTFSVESASGNAYTADDGGFSSNDDSTRKSRAVSMSSTSGQLMHVGDVAVFDSDTDDNTVRKGTVGSSSPKGGGDLRPSPDGLGNPSRLGVTGIVSSGDLEGQSEEVVYERIYETFPAGHYEDELVTTEPESEPFQHRYLYSRNPSVSGELGGHEVEHDEYITFTQGMVNDEDFKQDEDDAKDLDGNAAKASMGILAKKLSSGLRSLRNRRLAKTTQEDEDEKDDVGGTGTEETATDVPSEPRDNRLDEVDLEAQDQTDGETTLEGERFIMSDADTEATGVNRERPTDDESLSWLPMNAKPANPPAVAPRKFMGRLFSSHRKGSTSSKDEESKFEGSVGAVSSAPSATSEALADTVHTDRSGDVGETSTRSTSGTAENRTSNPSAGNTTVSSSSNEGTTKKKKPMWKSTVDPSSGLTYYYHNVTKETTWEKPDDFVERPPRKSQTKKGSEDNVTVEASTVTEEGAEGKPGKDEILEEEEMKKDEEMTTELTRDSEDGPEVAKDVTTTPSRQKPIRQVQTWDESKEPGPSDKGNPPAVKLAAKTRSFEFDPVAWAKKMELTSMLTAMTMSEPERPVEKEPEPPKEPEEPVVRPRQVLHDIDEEAPFDEPLPTASGDVPGPPPVVGVEQDRDNTSPLGDVSVVPEMEEPSSRRQLSPSPSSSGKGRTTEPSYDLKTRVMSSKTAVSSVSGLKSQAETMVSERTQKIANTTMKIYAAVKDQNQNNNSVNSSFSSHLSPLKTDGTFVIKATDHSHEKNLSPLRHPGGNEVPRERELKSEEYTGRMYGLTSEEFSDQNAANRIPPSRRFGTADSSTRGGDTTPNMSEPEYESSYAGDNENDPESETWGSDSVSGLSGSEQGFGRISREMQIKKKALEEAIKMGQWERAASFADDLRSVEPLSRDSSVNHDLLELSREETKVYDAETNGDVFRQQFIKNDGNAKEWKQTELDKFISQNDWTSVAQYITHMRETSPRRKVASPVPEAAPKQRARGTPSPRPGRSLSSPEAPQQTRSRSGEKAKGRDGRRSRSPGFLSVPNTVVSQIMTRRKSPAARRTPTAAPATTGSTPPTNVVTTKTTTQQQQPQQRQVPSVASVQMPRKRFGARSQLQHDSIMSDSSWESSSQLEDVTESEEDFISSASDRQYHEEAMARRADITKFRSDDGASNEDDGNTRMGFHRRMQV